MGKCELCNKEITDKDAYGIAESGALYCIECLSDYPIHIIPEDDIDKHTNSADCKCNPYQESGIWIHLAFDCRELLDIDGINWN